MSRTRKAEIIATFSYVQFGLALVSGIMLLPFILRHIGTQSYGLWLACGDLLAYSAMVDLGVLGVLPWLIAEQDGRGDRQGIRDLISNGAAVASMIGIVYVLAALLLWFFASRLINVTDAQRAVLAGPLLLIVLITAIAFPLRAFFTVLVGLQDAVFTGWLSVGQWALNICLIVLLVWKGYGLYSLAAAASIPPLLSSVLSLIRIKLIAPDLLADWHRPSFPRMFYLVGQGFGGWMGSFGWRMAAASNSIIIVSIGSPELVVVYACTAKLGEILMQLAWQLSDSGLVGLAQLSGEGKQQRVREVVQAMLRILLIAAGGVVVVMLAFNANFVSLWVGADKFGGGALNMLLAAGVLCLSFSHGLLVPAAVLGSRLRVGLITLMQGVFNLALALVLGYFFGLRGIAAASLCSIFILAIPFGARVLKRETQLSFADLARTTLLPWALRFVVMLVLSLLIGIWMPQKSVLLLLALAPIVGLLYVWHMRPLYVNLPLPLRMRPWLIRMRLIPQQ
ncbi:MAG TPA: hypothetical protein VGC91_11935 [Pyrinomonadaceae bacterium]